MSRFTRAALIAAVAATALPAQAAAGPTVNAARACAPGSLAPEFTEIRAREMSCRGARRAIKRGKFTGGQSYRFTTRGFYCKRVSGNYSYGLYKCRGGERVFRFRYRHPENPDPDQP